MGEAFDDMMDDAGIEDAAEHLRRDFIEAIEQLDGSRAERRDLESTHLLEMSTCAQMLTCMPILSST